MLDVIEQLRGYGEQLETLVEPVAPTLPVPTERRRRSGLVPALVGAVTVLALIGGVAILAGRTGTGIPSLAARDIPSFRALLAYPSSGEGLSSGTVEVRYDAATGALAIEIIDQEPGVLDGSFGSGPGSFFIYDGEKTTVGLAEDGFAYEIPDPQAEQSGLSEYAWPTYWQQRCANGHLTGTSIVVGREATGVRCSDAGTDWNVWVDSTTGVMLKVEGPIDFGDDRLVSTEVGFEVISIAYDPKFAEDDFAVTFSVEQQEAIDSARFREESLGALPGFRARVSREFTGEAASEAGVRAWSDEVIIWYQPGVGVRYEVVGNTLDDGYDSPGSFTVWAAEQRGHYEKADGSWFIDEETMADAERIEVAPEDEVLQAKCDQLPDGELLGRTVHRYENCLFFETGPVSTLWVDADTGLLLLRDGGGERFEVLELEIDPDFPADTFVFTPPPGSRELGTDPWAGLRFGPGDEVPGFTGNFLDGSLLDLGALRGRPVLVYLWASWCPPATCDLEKAQQLHDLYGDRVTVVAFASQDDPSSVQALIAGRSGLTIPVGLCEPDCRPDDPGPLWRIPGYPFWVLIDAEGTAVQVFLGGDTTIEEIAAVLEGSL
jgi:thiol-disulfide isomerase/thioredoxin